MSLARNKPAITKKIILVFISIAFCLIVLELGLRLGGFIFTGLQEYSNRTSFYRKGSYKIMCLGESTTAGQYPHFLKDILNQRNIGVKFNIIDKGAVGTNTINILSRLEDNLDTYKPDMVVAMMGNNDAGVRYYKDIPEADTGIFRHCRLYRFIRLIYMHIAGKLKHEGIYGLDKTGSKISVALKERGTTVGKGSFPNEESLKKAIALNPKNDQAYVELGNLYLQPRQFQRAEEYSRKAIELNPKNDQAYVNLGWSYLVQKQFQRAEDSFRKAIELNTSNYGAYFGLGSLYRDQKQLQLAEEWFKKAIKLNPKKDGAYFGLGGLYRNQGQFQLAEECFRKSLESDLPDNKSDSYGALATLYGETGQSALAQEYYRKANELRLNVYNSMTTDSYHKLKEILDKRRIKLVCVQYPMRSVEPLKRIFEGQQGIIFVDNEKVFKDAVSRQGYKEYFRDVFEGDFGHCTDKGNRLLAENIASVILKEVFDR